MKKDEMADFFRAGIAAKKEVERISQQLADKGYGNFLAAYDGTQEGVMAVHATGPASDVVPAVAAGIQVYLQELPRDQYTYGVIVLEELVHNLVYDLLAGEEDTDE